MVLDLYAILWYWAWTGTQPFTLPNFMLILRVIALGTFLKHLIITEDNQVQRVNTDPSGNPNPLQALPGEITPFKSMYAVCSGYFQNLKSKVQEFIDSGKFSLAALSEGSGQMRLSADKIIVLVSPFKIEKELNMLDKIQKLKTDCECFPVYSWVYSDQIHTYVILRAEAPLEMIKMMCLNKVITNEQLNLHRHMKMFHDKLINHFLETDCLTSSRCIPVFVEKVGHRDGWLIKCIMKRITQNEESESTTTVCNGSNLRNRKNVKLGKDQTIKPVKKMTKAIQSSVKFPDQEDGAGMSSSNSQATVENQSRSTLPNDVTPSFDEEMGKLPENIVEQHCMENGDERETNSCTEKVSSNLQTSCPQDPSLPVGSTSSPSDLYLEDDIPELDECNPHDSEKNPLIDENEGSSSCVINIESNPKSTSAPPVPAEKLEKIINPGRTL